MPRRWRDEASIITSLFVIGVDGVVAFGVGDDDEPPPAPVLADAVKADSPIGTAGEKLKSHSLESLQSRILGVC